MRDRHDDATDFFLSAVGQLLIALVVFRMLPIVAAALIAFAGHPEADAALADRASLPAESQIYATYLSLVEVPARDRERLEKTLRFVVPSLSSKSYLPDQLPQRVTGRDLLRLDLQGLGWENTWPAVVAKYYVPIYRPDLVGTKGVPLVVSGAWLAAVVTDPELSGDAQYQLLYGGKPPKNETEFRAFWHVTNKPELFFGRIEGRSGVAVQLTRLMENHPVGNRGYHWQTYDSAIVAGATDPLENLTSRPPKHDASELIAGIPKHAGEKAGALQAYFLANAKGERQEKAPANIVRDDTGLRGVEIKNTLSCISCHDEGLKHPTLDEYAAYIQSGARVYAPKAVAQEIDRYLHSPIAKEINRANEEYATAVELCNGLTTRENALAFQAVVRAWDAPLGIEQAALELYTSADEWRLAIGNYSRTHQLTARLAGMPQGAKLTRQQWEQNVSLAQQVLAAWTTNK